MNLNDINVSVARVEEKVDHLLSMVESQSNWLKCLERRTRTLETFKGWMIGLGAGALGLLSAIVASLKIFE